jgi:hypothetical protein
MREAKAAPRKRMIPIFQRFAISLTLATLFLASGTGLVGASSSALPGENLYRVKRTWEDVRLLFAFNPEHKGLLESEFESERLDEVDELLAEGRHESIQYSGIFRQVKGVMYVAGVKVLLPDNIKVPADGVAVVIIGRTNAQKLVEIESIEELPAGVVVPIGKPVEIEDESEASLENDENSNSNSNSGSESGSGSGNESQEDDGSVAPKADPQSFEMSGTVESVVNNVLIVNGQTVYLENTKIDGVLSPGATVEIKGYYAADGRFIVTEIKVKTSGSKSIENEGSNSGSNSNDDSVSNSNDGSNSNEESNNNDGGDSNSSDGGSNGNDDGGDSGGGGGNSNDNNNDH